MNKLNDVIKSLLPEVLEDQLSRVLSNKINRCWEGNIKGFWLKLSSSGIGKSGITIVKVDISFLKAIPGAQIELIFTTGHDDYLEQRELEENFMIKKLHNKNDVYINVKYLEDTILNKLDVLLLDEDYLASKRNPSDLYAELKRLQNQNLKNTD